MKTRPIISVSAIAALLLPCAAFAQADVSAYPSRPVRWIVSLAAGGNADIVARLLAQKLGERYGQQFVVDNRPGAAGTIAAELVSRAPRDGYTLLMVGSSFGITPSLYKLAYDPLKDLAPVIMPANAPGLLVVYPALPVRTVKDLIDLARAKPGQLNYASPGSGSAAHLAGALFNRMAGVEMIHVPYKAATAVMIDLIGGQVQLSFASMPSALGQVGAGRLRGVAVTGLKRSAAVPDLPTVAESGVPGFESGAWQGVFAPAGTPAPIVAKLNRDIARVVQLPDVIAQLAKDGAEPVGNTAEEFARWLPAEIAKWAGVVKAAGIRAE